VQALWRLTSVQQLRLRRTAESTRGDLGGSAQIEVGKMETAGSHWSEIVRVPSPLLGVTESPA